MAPRKVLIQARFATVRRDFEEVLEKVTPEMLTWSPREGMRTVSGQLVEIIATEMQIISLLREDRGISDDDAKGIIGDCHDMPNLMRAIEAVRKETLDYLELLSEALLAEEVEFGSLGLPKVPRAEVFLNIADHEWYHVGQLTSYLWILGINPYGRTEA